MSDLSVVMPARLSAYQNAATRRREKLRRAVSSFIGSEGDFSAELIIVSDGCDVVDDEWRQLTLGRGVEAAEFVAREGRVLRYLRVEKTTEWGAGTPRNAGLEAARGRVIAYLDSDDFVQPGHFASVLDAIGAHDWILFNWHRALSVEEAQIELYLSGKDGSDVWFADGVVGLNWPTSQLSTRLKFGSCGTGSFAHRRDLPVRWTDGYGDDWHFIEQLEQTTSNFAHKPIGGYVVCHVPGDIDL